MSGSAIVYFHANACDCGSAFPELAHLALELTSKVVAPECARGALVRVQMHTVESMNDERNYFALRRYPGYGLLDQGPPCSREGIAKPRNPRHFDSIEGRRNSVPYI